MTRRRRGAYKSDVKRHGHSTGHSGGRLGSLTLAMASLLLAPTVHASTSSEAGSPVRSEVACHGCGSSVRAGESVELSWDRVGGEVKELELLLSVDDGSETWVRLTEQLPPDTVSYTWRVPQLPTGGARIRLRVGIPGRGEVEGPPGQPFAITSAGADFAAPLRWRSGEWWAAGVALPASPLGPRPSGVSQEPSLTAFHTPLSIGLNPRPGAAAPDPEPEPATVASAPDVPHGRERLSRPRPGHVPLRC